jgi:pyruvate/2-oxoglutarate/acetoin dehydrogenase E1 component
MRDITYAQALNEALAEELEYDPRVFLMGEDIGQYGGVFGVSKGLLDRFGPERVRDTPISETGFIGCGVGAALMGKRPVVEVMWVDFALVAMDQIVNQAAKLRYMSGGALSVPMVIRTQQGGYRGNGAQHSQSLETYFAHIPGLKVVFPSTPHDAKALLKAAIRDPDPVIFLEHKMLYTTRGNPDDGAVAELGKADVKRKGNDATIITYGRTVFDALQAAQAMEGEGKSVEVLDLRSLVPLDIDAVLASVRKTHRVLIVHEATRFVGVGAELAATIQELVFDDLDAPIGRVGAEFVPIPYAAPLEGQVLPDAARIGAALHHLWN